MKQAAEIITTIIPTLQMQKLSLRAAELLTGFIRDVMILFKKYIYIYNICKVLSFSFLMPLLNNYADGNYHQEHV